MSASSTSSGGHPLKNIAIGVVTTVLASAIVYFLGFHSSNKEEIQKRRVATVNAWKSISDYNKYSTQKFKTIACFSCDQQEMKAELIRELEQNCNSLKNLKEDGDIDEKMKSIIDRNFQKFTDLKAFYGSFFDSLIAQRTHMTGNDLVVGSQKLQRNGLKRKEFIETRDDSDINNFLKDINKKYKIDLKQTEEKPEFDASALPGKWKIECSIDMTFNNDGSIVWLQSGTEFDGKWTLKSNNLTINLDNGQVIKYLIAELSKKMLLLYEPESKSIMGGCPQ